MLVSASAWGWFPGHFCFLGTSRYSPADSSIQNAIIPNEESRECQRRVFFLHAPPRLTQKPAAERRIPNAKILMSTGS